jgi:hypothetical protein
MVFVQRWAGSLGWFSMYSWDVKGDQVTFIGVDNVRFNRSVQEGGQKLTLPADNETNS